MPREKSDFVNVRALVAIGYPAVAPYVQEVLEGDDLQWKYWCIVRLISKMRPEVAGQFRDELTRLAEFPTAAERLDELDEVAGGALRKLGFAKGD